MLTAAIAAMYILVPIAHAFKVQSGVMIWMAYTMFAEPFKDAPIFSPVDRSILEWVVRWPVMDGAASTLAL